MAASAGRSGGFALQGGNSEFGYTLASAASSAIVTIQDANGNTVAQFSGTGNNGANNVSWNGQNNNGTQLPDGPYTYTVAATDSSGNAVATSAPTVFAKARACKPIRMARWICSAVA